MPQAILVTVSGDIRMIEVPDTLDSSWGTLMNDKEPTECYVGYLFGDHVDDWCFDDGSEATGGKFCHTCTDVSNDTAAYSEKYNINELLSSSHRICRGDAIIFVCDARENVSSIPELEPKMVKQFLELHKQVDLSDPEEVEALRAFVEALGFVYENIEIATD